MLRGCVRVSRRTQRPLIRYFRSVARVCSPGASNVAHRFARRPQGTIRLLGFTSSTRPKVWRSRRALHMACSRCSYVHWFVPPSCPRRMLLRPRTAPAARRAVPPPASASPTRSCDLILALAQRAEPFARANLDWLRSWRQLRVVPPGRIGSHCSLVGGSIVKLASRERSFSSCCRHNCGTDSNEHHRLAQA
jgi:hypothetical protein